MTSASRLPIAISSSSSSSSTPFTHGEIEMTTWDNGGAYVNLSKALHVHAAASAVFLHSTQRFQSEMTFEFERRRGERILTCEGGERRLPLAIFSTNADDSVIGVSLLISQICRHGRWLVPLGLASESGSGLQNFHRERNGSQRWRRSLPECRMTWPGG